MQAGGPETTGAAPPPAVNADVSGHNPRLHPPSQQPVYPGATGQSTPAPTPAPAPTTPTLLGAATREPLQPLTTAAGATTAAAAASLQFPPPTHDYQRYIQQSQSPFRNRAAAAGPGGFNPRTFQRPLRRFSAARLWNPTNSTPRAVPRSSAAATHGARPRRPSTPPPPSVPLSHPVLDDASGHLGDRTGTALSGDYPLLTLPEQRQSRHSLTARASLQVERSGGSDQRVSLPKSVRHSYDEKRLSRTPTKASEPEAIAGPSWNEEFYAPEAAGDTSAPQVQRKVTGLRRKGQSVSQPQLRSAATEAAAQEELPHPQQSRAGKGKGKAAMAPENEEDHEHPFVKDIERGPDVLGHRNSTASVPPGIGSAISSSNSSIMGDPDQQPDVGEEWGPQHPCYPHLNPHVPVDSPEYASTRIIRIRRDWLLEGDLAPTFSNLYPEILDPAGLSEQEFRRVIEKLNGELVPVFDPYSARNILDGVLGLATGWLWEDLGLAGVKPRLKRLEKWIEQWNLEMEKNVGHGGGDGVMAPKIVPLRRTGYMSLDIQIPDPEIAPAPSTPGASRIALPLEPPPVAGS